MPDDRFNMPFPGESDDTPLSEALLALPQVAPQASVLPALKARLAQRQRAARSRRWLPLAAAAAVCALALSPLLRKTDAPDSRAAAAVDPQIAALIAQNQVYESALRSASFGGRALSARDALAGAEIEDLIGMLDLELSAAGDGPATRDLWQQRLALMQGLASVRARGSGELMAVNDPRMLPANWQLN